MAPPVILRHTPIRVMGSAGSQNSSQTTGNSEKQDTRSKRGEGTLRTVEEIRQDPSQDIKDSAGARKFLMEGLYVPPGVPMTLDVLANVLLGLTQAKGISGCKTTQVALRSVAFVLNQVDHDDRTEKITEAVSETLNTRLTEIQTHIKEGIDVIEKKMKTIIDVAGSNMEEVRIAVKGAADSMEGATTSYKKALINGMPATQSFTRTSAIDPRLRAREGIRQRQILVDLDASDSSPGLKSCSNVALVDAANKAINSLDSDTEHKVVGATRLPKGGILLETNSNDAAVWLRDLDRKDAFVTALDPGAKIRTRLYSTIAQFVPVSFGPENDSEILEVEENNGMKRGDIGSMRWIKPANRRQLNQSMAHLAIRYTSPEAANNALLNGIFICGTRVMSIKGKREPIRCLKCHGWDHLAAVCTKDDKCGTCAGGHRTATCNSKIYYCTPCSSSGHASWSRDCPTFRAKCALMDKRLPENSMPYYPTDEEWTQNNAPSSAPPFGKVSMEIGAHNTNFRNTRSYQRSRSGTPATGANTQEAYLDAPPRFTPMSPTPWHQDEEGLDGNPIFPLTNV